MIGSRVRFSQRFVLRPQSWFFAARVSHDLNPNLSLGAIYTDQEFAQGWNRLGGIDFVDRLSKSWTATGQIVESSTKNTRDGTSNIGYAAGPASYLESGRIGHSFNFDETYQDFSSGLHTRLGFIPTTNNRSERTHLGYLRTLSAIAVKHVDTSCSWAEFRHAGSSRRIASFAEQ